MEVKCCYDCRRYSPEKPCPLGCVVTDGRCWEPKSVESEGSIAELLSMVKEFRNEICNRSQYQFWGKLVDKADSLIAKVEEGK